MACRVGADVSESLEGHCTAGQAVVSPPRLGRRLHAQVDAQSGHERGVAASSQRLGQSDDVLRLLGYVLEVVGSHAYVLSRDVPPSERIDVPPEGAKHGLGLVGAGVCDDEGLRPAKVESGDGGLVGHRAGQSEHVHDGVVLACVRPHPEASAAGTQGGVVNRDERPQALRRLMADEQLLVAVRLHVFEDFHELP